MAVHVTIHDVAPNFREEIELALDLCREAGVRPGLLVVPDFHGDAPLEQAPEFVAFVRSLAEQGSEIFLHGFTHRAERGQRGRVGRWFRQRIVSNGEAEFGELSTDEAARRLDAGLGTFARLGLSVDGFVPPAWTMQSSLLGLLRERGIRYTENHFEIMNPVLGTRRLSGVLNFATRSVSRLVTSVGYVRGARVLKPFLPLRVAIHPADMRFEITRRETQRLLAWAAGDFVTRAEELFGAP